MKVGVILEVHFSRAAPGLRREEVRVSVGGEEAVPLPPAGPAGAGALGWAAGVESSAAAAAGPKPHAARLKVVQNKSSQFHKLCRNVRDPWGTVS